MPITNTLPTDDEEDEDVSTAPAKPRRTPTPSLPRMPGRKAKAAASQAWLGLAPKTQKPPKENPGAPRDQSLGKRVSADKRGAARPGRVPSLRAS